MKRNIHPDYREVVFQDISTGEMFLTRSTVLTNETITLDDGKVYPLVRLEVSSASHPFFTKEGRRIETKGPIERFRQKYQISSVGAIRPKSED
jgi:large subunit ribosomal protein L31